MKQDQADILSSQEPDSFFEKVEQATPSQVSQAIIAKILLKLKKNKKSS
jgi:hypothetical protein